MARRARTTPKITWLLIALVLVVFLIGLGAYIIGITSAPFRSSPIFPVEEYLTTSTSLRGNSYHLTGAVINSIAWSPDDGRLISIQPENSQASIPIVIPSQFSNFNIQKGQKFHFLVEVRENGILYVNDLTKS